MTVPPPEPTTDLTAARWVEEEVGDFGSGVRALLPGRFERYARILHPAMQMDGADVIREVTWAEAAEWADCTIHPTVQFKRIEEAAKGRGGSPPWTQGPDQGDPPEELLETLCDVLDRHTSTTDLCWFCLWEGWGWLEGDEGGNTTYASLAPDPDPPPPDPPAFPPEIINGQRVQLPGRAYVLLHGPLSSITSIGWYPPEDERWGRCFTPQPPSIFWPDDRAWCVASEIDLNETYLGGTAALIEELLADPRLEVLPAELDDRIDWEADQVDRKLRRDLSARTLRRSAGP